MCYPGVYYSSWDQLVSFICRHALSWKRRQGKQDIVEPSLSETWAMTSPGAGLCRCTLERLKGWPLLTDRHTRNKTLPQVAPHPGLSLSHSTPPPRIALERTGELMRQKGQESPEQGTVWPPVGLQAPYSSRDSILGTWGSKTDMDWGGGRQLGPLSTTIVPSLIPVTSSFPLPTTHLATSTWPPPGPRSTGSDASSSV